MFDLHTDDAARIPAALAALDGSVAFGEHHQPSSVVIERVTAS
ncbi:hypothetical protein ABZ372_08995 [Streptomyces sp. NPDC005921]